MNINKTILEVKNLTFGYEKDKDVLKNVSFSVQEGEYVSIVGVNGSGKSTLAKIIMHILSPKSGEIYFDGLLINDDNFREIKEKIGIVFQNPDNQFIGSSVEDDIAFGLENRNIPYEKMHELVKIYSKKVGMDKFLNKTPDQLSGGQKQRVALAGILALSLDVIILDEATSMLDPEGKKDIKNLIIEMKKENPRLTIISITHDVEEAYLSDKIIILDKGTIKKSGSPKEVFENEEEVINIGLDIPFVLKVKNALKNKYSIDENILSIEELSKFICHS